MEGIKPGVFHIRRREYIQEWMRTISEYTEEDANDFGRNVKHDTWRSISIAHAPFRSHSIRPRLPCYSSRAASSRSGCALPRMLKIRIFFCKDSHSLLYIRIHF